MSKKQSDNAAATMPGPTNTPTDMVDTGNAAISAMNGSPALASAPEVQAALGLFAAENANLEANNKKKENLRQELALTEAEGVTITRRWRLRRRGLLHAVDTYADGSKEKVQSLNLGTIERSKLPPAGVPTNLRQAHSKKPSTVVVVWSKPKGADGYLVQVAADPADPATYAAPVMCKRARFALAGQALGATLHVRVRALDAALPGGQSDDSPWLPVTVGAV
jgi:hypothetical protein